MHVMMQMTTMLELGLMKKEPFMIHRWSMRMDCLNKTYDEELSDNVYESNDDESNDDDCNDDKCS